MRIPRPRLPRRTARLRLTVLCGGVFALGATTVPAITYLVASLMANPARRPGNGAFGGTSRVTTGITAHQLTAMRAMKLQGAAQMHALEMEHLLIWSGIALAIAIVAAVVPGWFIAGKVLRPLSAITTTARRISATNLHQRLALQGPGDELKELGDTLDDLFARLEASFDAQRRFVANASHELRTPLTRERALLQVTRANPARTLGTWQAVSAELLASNVPGGHLQVTTGTSRGRAVVSVTNSGPVIPPAEVDRLFEPFQRLGARRARGDGHGLGLSIVHAIAAAHGAAITAQPVPGGGLAVTVSFPASAPPRAGRPPAGQAVGRSAA